MNAMSEAEVDTLCLDPAVGQVVDAARHMKPLTRRLPGWALSIATHDQGGRCFWCSKSVVPLVAAPLVRCGAGGTTSPLNVVAVCSACRSKVGTADPLALCHGDQAKQERRARALDLALCHPVVEALRDRGTKLKRLRARWEHPRFTALLHRGWHASTLVWPAKSMPPAHLVALLRATGSVERHGQWWAAVVQADKADAALAVLVEHNALLRSVVFPSLPELETPPAPYWLALCKGVKAAAKGC